MPYLGSTTLENVLDRIASLPDERRTRKAAVILDVLRACVSRRIRRLVPLIAASKRAALRRARFIWPFSWPRCSLFCTCQVCHRDLKPSNVLLNPSGKALLLDFNLSTSERETNVPMGGSLGYTAPEQIRLPE